MDLELSAEPTHSYRRLCNRTEWQFRATQLGQRIGNRETIDVIGVFRRATTAETGTAVGCVASAVTTSFEGASLEMHHS